MQNRKLKILYHLPNPDTIYAGRTIYYGFKHAFEDLGHEFKTLTPNSIQKQLFEEYKPDLFMTSMGPLTFKYLDLSLIKKQKSKGMKVSVNTPFWKSPMSKFRINEAPSISQRKDYVRLIRSGTYGDIYYNNCEQGDLRMEGFEKATGYEHHTVLLAADKTIATPQNNERFKADISFIGTLLPGKKKFIEECVLPLRKKYVLRLYGADWTFYDRALNFGNKVGQYLNIPLLRSFKKPQLSLKDERSIYRASTISLNIHEDYQKQFEGDINERTFKIPISGGFEIVDNVSSLKKYFKDGEDIIIAKNKKDWFEKIEYYLKNPDRRLPIIEAGKNKVMQHHTYNNRVQQIIKIYRNI